MTDKGTMVCFCKKISLGVIQTFLQEDPQATVEDIMKATSAGTRCGSCKDGKKGKALNLEAIVAAKG